MCRGRGPDLPGDTGRDTRRGHQTSAAGVGPGRRRRVAAQGRQGAPGPVRARLPLPGSRPDDLGGLAAGGRLRGLLGGDRRPRPPGARRRPDPDPAAVPGRRAGRPDADQRGRGHHGHLDDPGPVRDRGRTRRRPGTGPDRARSQQPRPQACSGGRPRRSKVAFPLPSTPWRTPTTSANRHRSRTR